MVYTATFGDLWPFSKTVYMYSVLRKAVMSSKVVVNVQIIVNWNQVQRKKSIV